MKVWLEKKELDTCMFIVEGDCLRHCAASLEIFERDPIATINTMLNELVNVPYIDISRGSKMTLEEEISELKSEVHKRGAEVNILIDNNNQLRDKNTNFMDTLKEVNSILIKYGIVCHCSSCRSDK